MHEYEVSLTNGTAFVYADLYMELGGMAQFWKGDAVVKEYSRSQVKSIKENW